MSDEAKPWTRLELDVWREIARRKPDNKYSRNEIEHKARWLAAIDAERAKLAEAEERLSQCREARARDAEEALRTGAKLTEVTRQLEEANELLDNHDAHDDSWKYKTAGLHAKLAEVTAERDWGLGWIRHVLDEDGWNEGEWQAVIAWLAELDAKAKGGGK